MHRTYLRGAAVATRKERGWKSSRAVVWSVAGEVLTIHSWRACAAGKWAVDVITMSQAVIPQLRSRLGVQLVGISLWIMEGLLHRTYLDLHSSVASRLDESTTAPDRSAPGEKLWSSLFQSSLSGGRALSLLSSTWRKRSHLFLSSVFTPTCLCASGYANKTTNKPRTSIELILSKLL